MAHMLLASYQNLGIFESKIDNFLSTIDLHFFMLYCSCLFLILPLRKVYRDISFPQIILLFCFFVAIPVTMFVAAHHGSFSRAIASNFAVGGLLWLSGHYNFSSRVNRIWVIICSFLIHPHAVFIIIAVLVGEVFLQKFRKDIIIKLFQEIILALFLLYIYLTGNQFSTATLNGITSIYDVWRTEIITDFKSLLNYSNQTVFSGTSKMHSYFLYFCFFIGLAASHRSRILKYSFLSCLFFMTIYISILLLSNDNKIVGLLAQPIAGALSRLYEPITIFVALVCALGLVSVLNYINKFKHVVVCFLIIPFTLLALQTQSNLSRLAIHFDTLERKSAQKIFDHFDSKNISKVQVISKDQKYQVLGGIEGWSSLLSYYDCPRPLLNSESCIAKQEYVDFLIQSAQVSADISCKSINYFQKTEMLFIVNRGKFFEVTLKNCLLNGRVRTSGILRANEILIH